MSQRARSYDPSEEPGDDGPSPFWTVAALGLVILVLLTIGYVLFTTRVDAGYACSITRNGKQVGNAQPGLHYTTPWPRPVKYHCFHTRVQTAQYTDGKSEATYVLDPFSTHSNDGQPFTVGAKIQYRIEPSYVGTIYTQGARNDKAVWNLLVRSQVDAILPQTLTTYSAQQLYTDPLSPISDQVKADINANLAQYGIILTSVVIDRPNVNDQYEAAIEQAGLQQAEAQAKIAQQEVAKQEAERQRIEAEGNAQASIIAQNAVNTNTISAGQAQAQALQAQAEIYDQSPGLLDHERIQAIGQANVIYLPSDSVLPILNLTGSTDQVSPGS